jgi:organic hydroperoxide reductase OsmC/OhrA
MTRFSPKQQTRPSRRQVPDDRARNKEGDGAGKGVPLSAHGRLDRRAAGGRAGGGQAGDRDHPAPVFRGTDLAAWSPEDFFVAAAASYVAVTFTGRAAKAGLAYRDLHVEADGPCGRRDDGRFGFTRILLTIKIETDDARDARRLAEQAEENCLVSASLDLPVETVIEVKPRRPS